MKGKELVSVIIPNYNGANWIEKTIESCLLQVKFLKEIIVVDDFSTDNSWEILARIASIYPTLISCYRNSTKGGNNARNFGFEKVSGKYIQWLDSDDQILPGKLEAQVEELEKSDTIDIVYSDWRLDTFDVSGELIRTEQKKQKKYQDFLEEILKNNWSPLHSYLIRKSMAAKLYEINAWNPNTKVGQDREYFTLAALLGAEFSYVPGYFCVYNRRDNISVSKAKQQVVHEALLSTSFRFKKLAENIKETNKKKKGYYIRLIDTTIAQSCALSFVEDFHPRPNVFQIDWNMINGNLTKLKVLWWLITGKKIAKRSTDKCNN